MKEQNLKDEFYKLNIKTYKKQFLPIYDSLKIKPKTIFQSSVILPFHIPIKAGTCVTMKIDSDTVFTLIFDEINTIKKLNAGIIDNEPSETPVSQTVAEFILTTQKNEFPNAEKGIDLISFLFDFCTEKLNFFITSYLIVTKDISAHRVTIKMYEFASLFRIIDPITWNYAPSLFLFHMNVPYQKSVLNDEKTQKVIWYANVINQKWNPFILFEELMLNAKRNFIAGFHKESVIYCQTAFETFLRTLLSEFYEEEGKTSNDLNEIFDESGFIRVLKKEFHGRIGGNWNINDNSKNIGKWYANCYSLRNKIIHAGYEPSHKETNLAIASSEFAITEILELVKLQKNKYPKVFEFIVLQN